MRIISESENFDFIMKIYIFTKILEKISIFCVMEVDLGVYSTFAMEFFQTSRAQNLNPLVFN